MPGFKQHPLLKDKLKNFDNLFCEENKNNKIVSSYCEYYSPDLYTYKYNNYGYRSIEFSNDVDILTAGCSHTFGSGLPFEYTWSQQLQKLMPNKKIATLAWPGYSIQKIISSIFIYFKKIGNPKMIICNFPDFYRMLFLLKDSHIICGYYSNIEDNIFFDKKDKKELKNSIPSPYWGFYLSYDYILMLEQYCSSNNISLIWSTWSLCGVPKNFDGSKFKHAMSNIFDENYNDAIKQTLKNNFDYYHDDYESSFYFGNLFYPPSKEVENCHGDLKTKTEDFFSCAYDRYILPEEDVNNFEKHIKMSREEKDKNLNHHQFYMGHHGSHRHAHWAEFYYGIIKEQYPDFI